MIQEDKVTPEEKQGKDEQEPVIKWVETDQMPPHAVALLLTLAFFGVSIRIAMEYANQVVIYIYVMGIFTGMSLLWFVV
jgi:hypothetical protein